MAANNAHLYRAISSHEFIGPEGKNLQDFIELHCPLTQHCHLGMLMKERKFKVNGKTIVEQESNSPSRAPVLQLNETLQLTSDGEAFLTSSASLNNLITYQLKCKGGFADGEDATSGANCQKVAHYPNWCKCNGTEKCPSSCGFALIKQPHSANCPRYNPENMLGEVL